LSAETDVTWEQHQAGRSLTAAAIRGDGDALRSLWQQHRRWVAAILLAHKPAQAELEDLLQEVAMSYVRMIGRLRDEAMLKPWLRTVAINAARAAGRGAARKRRFPGLALAGAGARDGMVDPAPGAASGDQDEGARLLSLASRMPEGYREPLLLRCVRGMSYRQISELTGLPESTIETRIARGRRMLRELAAAPAGPAHAMGVEP
jgi:RNA polymerase sigma-70 factor (ECF subfamily)